MGDIESSSSGRKRSSSIAASAVGNKLLRVSFLLLGEPDGGTGVLLSYLMGAQSMLATSTSAEHAAQSLGMKSIYTDLTLLPTLTYTLLPYRFRHESSCGGG
jgi:hypothetical protein